MRILFVSFLFACILFAGCSDTNNNSGNNTGIAGGYTEIEVSSQEVTDCVNYLHTYFPTQPEYKDFRITEVERAFSQVVAGRNIKLICKVLKGTVSERWEFIVFIDLNDKYNFTSGIQQ